MTNLAIETAGLTKAYRGIPVLAGLDLAVPAATCFALLGPNGAGKTTTVRILATLIEADLGNARVAGMDVVADRAGVRSAISLSGQYAALDGLLTGQENLRLAGRLAGLSRSAARRRAAELLDTFDLGEVADRRVAAYSGGLRRRLDLAASLVSEPVVLFLDEPTTGLDLTSRRRLWQVIGELRETGVTVFLTTQYLEEADRLADRVAVLHGGAIAAEGSPAELKRQVAAKRLELTLTGRAAFGTVTRRASGRLLAADATALTAELETDGTAAHVRALLDDVDPDRTAVASLAVRSASLDDVFLALTGGPAVLTDKEIINV